MPNWCSNDIWLRGSKQDLDEYTEKYTTDGVMDFNKIVPMPVEYLEDGSWYDWRVENWGTKWNISNDDSGFWDRIDDKTIVATAETAWSPPLEVLLRLSILFPSLEIEIVYDESGEGFQGNYIFRAGKAEEIYHRTGDDYISPYDDYEDE